VLLHLRDYCKFLSTQKTEDSLPDNCHDAGFQVVEAFVSNASLCGRAYGRGAGVMLGEAEGGGVKRGGGVGRPAEVGDGLGVGEHLPLQGVGVGVGVGVAVAVGVAVTVAVAVAVAVGVGV
jgi:hypothetical protein